MNLPADLTAALIKATAKELADRMESRGLEDLELFTIREVAERLKVSEPKARALMTKHQYVELGESSKRVSAATLRRLIDERTIPA